MPVNPRLRAQIQLILDAHEDAAVFPDDWETTGVVDYIYRKDTILSYTRDVPRVIETLDRTFPVTEEEAARPSRFVLQPVSDGVTRITLQGLPSVAVVLDAADPVLGPGTITPDSFAYPSPYPCPATEPEEVPPGTMAPFPPVAGDAPCENPGHHGGERGCDGTGVSVSIVDTGLLANAASHPWLAGVTGTLEYPYYPGTDQILPYAGHGTFVAGVARSQAPRADVFVVQGFDSGTGKFESDLAPRIEGALDASLGVLLFTFVSATRKDLSLKTFDDLYERRIRHIEGLVVVTPAGNDGTSRRMWPAAYRWAVSVGALSADWQHRAHFSNYGDWVDVYAPGEDLVNAFATGDYICDEPPIGQHRHFHEMAKWSGTSFSTPMVVGLIAARMSGSGENGQQAAAALRQLAGTQLVDGVYPALYPGQACLDPGEDRQPAATPG